MPSIQAQIHILTGITVSLLILTLAKSEYPLSSNRFLKIKIKEIDSQLSLNTSQVVTTPPKQQRNATNTISPREFLIAHNKVRVTLGEPPLQWDKNLARYGRRWAAKRMLDCKMIHSYGPYGENIFWGGKDHWTATQVVRSWVNEYHYYHRETNDCDPQQMCGHYTQVVWRETTRVGCARIKCNDGGLFVICIYDPPGNYLNESPFRTATNSPPNMSPSSSVVTSIPSSPGTGQTPIQSGSSSPAPPTSMASSDTQNTNSDTASAFS